MLAAELRTVEQGGDDGSEGGGDGSGGMVKGPGGSQLGIIC